MDLVVQDSIKGISGLKMGYLLTFYARNGFCETSSVLSHVESGAIESVSGVVGGGALIDGGVVIGYREAQS